MKPQVNLSTDLADSRHQLLDDVITEQVLHALGQPTDLHRVQIKRLWQDRYRVNVLVGANVTSARVAHSFFLSADGDGNIVASSPGITKQY